MQGLLIIKYNVGQLAPFKVEELIEKFISKHKVIFDELEFMGIKKLVLPTRTEETNFQILDLRHFRPSDPLMQSGNPHEQLKKISDLMTKFTEQSK